MPGQATARAECATPMPQTIAHLLGAGVAGLATVDERGRVSSREGILSAWLPAVGHSCFESPILSGLDEDLQRLRDDPAAPLILPGIRLAMLNASPRCHILITWDHQAGEHAILTTIDQIDHPIDDWVRQQKREQRLLEEKLVVASRDLARVNESLREFTSIAAHDLQAPLRQISSFIGILRTTLGTGTSQLALDCIDTVEQCARRLTKMIAGLLDQARVSSERFSLEPVELRSVVEDAVANLAVDVREAGATITIAEMPTVMGSASLLTNLFQNLIANSLRYRSSDRAARIVVDMAVGPGAARQIRVTDTGIGIPSQYAKTVFSSFVRVSQPAAGGGVGLGLSLCRRIADIHGWSIRVDPTYSDGARICIDIGANKDV